MLTIQTHTAEFTGTNYEIGYQLGKLTAAIPPLRAAHTAGMENFGPKQAEEAAKLFDRWCPGLTDELRGFADALAVKPEGVFFYGMTYLLPRCSHIALLPGLTAERKPLLARNYEFSHEAEDFCLTKTSVTGKYTHMGTSVLHFGRDDGFNEHGLAITISSCGFPVGALPTMRAPKLKGLQFWAVIRALLENCKDVSESLEYLEGMPIAYNLNMILMDKAGNAALFETLDGLSAVKRIGPDPAEQMLYVTNHPVLPELKSMEPQVMAHSARRYDYIQEQLAGRDRITKEQLKKMLLAKYPDGLCCHYFEEFFGTTKSMVISPADGRIDLCWGGRAENGWHIYDITQHLENQTKAIQINMEKALPETYAWQPLC
ncbi:peptidase C45 acyl-coenzyme A:6-aminopenicillanic acid acyl-transferase [Desulfitobacterium hafniense DCB-2]|uniref:Peptidase C45 acyl-coenzyme A:6-aminopenicillanic acid acyl-transferase n=2 Tax=root TaxID=1 RepID=B8FSY1_DESHD|nr:C45 family peptidase [Desulfitobacterium hafniense]ACL21997.1 peptidase C45 acyl-coenzyme A:6-aminopenicillanic acid acyl-transferase [Desulfitobacterium hafniense DCB-2]MEA5022372.1 C45 family peptidase [Desulfitobacterium hafniense]